MLIAWLIASSDSGRTALRAQSANFIMSCSALIGFWVSQEFVQPLQLPCVHREAGS
jgi:hypothetical protein